MSNNTKKIKLPSMLSFERKLEISDGLMYAGNWHEKDKKETWSPIKIVPRQNRATQSAYGIGDSKKPAPNPVSSDNDDANLPMDKDTLKLSFSLRIIGNVGKPFACNLPDFATAIEQKVKAFNETDGLSGLAYRYAYNIANGRFLWRNRVGAKEIEIHVTSGEKNDSLVKFNAYNFALNDFDKNKDNEDLGKLVEIISQGLAADENNFAFVSIVAFVKLGAGQHVYPSQEMNMGEKKKKLFQLEGCAAMHNVKIGNAVRTIDTWYGGKMLIKAEGKDKTATVDIGSQIKYPIAIEPYGAVTQHGRAYRPKKNDLYTLMMGWANDNDVDADQQKYIVANLIRGGVFGGDADK